MASARLILLAAEDPPPRGFLADNLDADGYDVIVVDDQAAALALLEQRRPDLVLADVNGDTLDLIDAVRCADGLASRIEPDTPLIVLTAHADALARVRYLDRGGDDVVAKPFCYPELRARIARAAAPQPTSARADAAARRRAGDRHAAATSASARAGRAAPRSSRCSHLAGEPTRVFTKHELLRDVWGYRSRARTRTLDSHACRLRRKLRAAGDGAGSRTCGASATGSRASTPSERRSAA